MPRPSPYSRAALRAALRARRRSLRTKARTSARVSGPRCDRTCPRRRGGRSLLISFLIYFPPFKDKALSGGTRTTPERPYILAQGYQNRPGFLLLRFWPRDTRIALAFYCYILILVLEYLNISKRKGGARAGRSRPAPRPLTG